jgi:hypothetical protein
MDNAIPYRCPVCGGKGLVPRGFYEFNPFLLTTASGYAVENCRSCGGGGILWSYQENLTPSTPCIHFQVPPDTKITIS